MENGPSIASAASRAANDQVRGVPPAPRARTGCVAREGGGAEDAFGSVLVTLGMGARDSRYRTSSRASPASAASTAARLYCGANSVMNAYE